MKTTNAVWGTKVTIKSRHIGQAFGSRLIAVDSTGAEVATGALRPYRSAGNDVAEMTAACMAKGWVVVAVERS